MTDKVNQMQIEPIFLVVAKLTAKDQTQASTLMPNRTSAIMPSWSFRQSIRKSLRMLSKSVFLLVALATISSMTACKPDGFTFLDQNLEAVIREETFDNREGPIHTYELEVVTSLNASTIVD